MLICCAYNQNSYFCGLIHTAMDEKKISEKKVSRGGRRENAGRKAPNGKKSERLFLCVTPEFRAKIKDLAQSEKLSLSEFVVFLATDYERRKNEA